MNKKVAIALLLAALPLWAQTDSQWMLEQSTLTYHMSHPMHEVNGVSRAAKGKGTCHAGRCDFLIAAPVRSFDSGDSNRDLHMVEATRGAQFPMVVVRTQFPETAMTAPILYADLEVQFAARRLTTSRFHSRGPLMATKCRYPELFRRRVPISRSSVRRS